MSNGPHAVLANALRRAIQSLSDLIRQIGAARQVAGQAIVAARLTKDRAEAAKASVKAANDKVQQAVTLALKAKEAAEQAALVALSAATAADDAAKAMNGANVAAEAIHTEAVKAKGHAEGAKGKMVAVAAKAEELTGIVTRSFTNANSGQTSSGNMKKVRELLSEGVTAISGGAEAADMSSSAASQGMALTDGAHKGLLAAAKEMEGVQGRAAAIGKEVEAIQGRLAALHREGEKALRAASLANTDAMAAEKLGTTTESKCGEAIAVADNGVKRVLEGYLGRINS